MSPTYLLYSRLSLSICVAMVLAVVAVGRIDKDNIDYIYHPYASTLAALLPSILGGVLFYFLFAPRLLQTFDRRFVRCPHCNTFISAKAKVCRHCLRDVPPSENNPSSHTASVDGVPSLPAASRKALRSVRRTQEKSSSSEGRTKADRRIWSQSDTVCLLPPCLPSAWSGCLAWTQYTVFTACTILLVRPVPKWGRAVQWEMLSNCFKR